MNPQSKDSQFTITIKFIKYVNSLNDFADISHVEDIMRFCRSWQEILSNCIVKANCGKS